MNDWNAEKIKHLREVDYRESQEDFCRRLDVSIDTIRYWEQGRGAPSGPANILFGRLEEDAREGKIRELDGGRERQTA